MEVYDAAMILAKLRRITRTPRAREALEIAIQCMVGALPPDDAARIRDVAQITD